eukprot:scpid85316/ scgid9081/ Fas apoptotic inhibitory molecule 1
MASKSKEAYKDFSKGSDVVAQWNVPLRDKTHIVAFEHGAMLTGRRVVFVDGDVVVRKEFVFNLLGTESFRIGDTKCAVLIDPGEHGWTFKYTLIVNKKPLETFLKDNGLMTKTWLPMIKGQPRRVVLEKSDITIYVDGKKVETVAEFMDSDDEDGSESHTGTWQNFMIDDSACCKIKVYSSQDRFKGMLYDLYVHDKLVPVATRDKILETERPS